MCTEYLRGAYDHRLRYLQPVCLPHAFEYDFRAYAIGITQGDGDTRPL